MRVLALTKYERQAASTRQRLLQYLPFLADQGIEVDVKPLFNAQYLSDLAQNKPKNRLLVAKSYINRLGVLLKNHDYDLNWIHFEALPFMPAFVELLAMKGGPPFMVDMDDAIFHQYDAHANGAVRKALGGKIATLLDHAALVVAGNAYLAEYVRSHADVRVIPTVVDIEAYIPTKQDSSPTSRGGTVGWIGSPSTWRYVEPILPELLPLIERAGWRFRAVGAGPMADRHAGVDNIPWQEATEIAEVQQIDIGIMPLPDEPWARGKCGYKLIQYMACGLPTLASPVGVNAQIVEDGRTGFLCTSPEAWRDRIGLLMNDAGLRATMGANGRARVEAQYSLQSQRSAMADAFRDAAQGRRHGK